MTLVVRACRIFGPSQNQNQPGNHFYKGPHAVRLSPRSTASLRRLHQASSRPEARACSHVSEARHALYKVLPHVPSQVLQDRCDGGRRAWRRRGHAVRAHDARLDSRLVPRRPRLEPLGGACTRPAPERPLLSS